MGRRTVLNCFFEEGRDRSKSLKSANGLCFENICHNRNLNTKTK